MTYVEPYQNILKTFVRKFSSGDWYNEPIRLQFMLIYVHTFHPYGMKNKSNT